MPDRVFALQKVFAFVPKFTLDQLSGLSGSEHSKVVRQEHSSKATEIAVALGNLGLGDTGLRGLADDNEGAAVPSGDQLSTQTHLLDMVDDLEVRRVFETSITATRTLYERVGIIAPDIDELIAKGADFSHLADIYRREHDEGRAPELVFAPINLAQVQLKKLFSHLCHDASLPNNPLQTHSGGSDGILITQEVIANWTSLTGSIVLPQVDLIVGQTQYDSWSLRIVPGVPLPLMLELDHGGYDERGFLMQAPFHPTLIEYVTLQGMRIQTGQRVLDYDDDRNYSTWLSGSYQKGDESWATYGSFAMGRVMFASEPQDELRPQLGVRPVRW